MMQLLEIIGSGFYELNLTYTDASFKCMNFMYVIGALTAIQSKKCFKKILS